jgi:hypothetical protein
MAGNANHRHRNERLRDSCSRRNERIGLVVVEQPIIAIVFKHPPAPPSRHFPSPPTHPLFNVKFDSESRQDPSSEFESVKTKLVLWSCFWFLFNVELWIPTARQPVGIQIRFSIQCACVNRNSESELQSCGRLRSDFGIFFSILLFFFQSFESTMTNSQKKQRRKKIIVMMAMAIIQSSIILLEKQRASASRSRSYRKPIIGRTRNKIVNIRRCLGSSVFWRAYRLSKEKFDELVKILEPNLPSKERIGPNGIIPVELELSIALWYFAGGSPLDFIGSHGMSFTSIWNSIWRIVDAINECEQLHIRFPEDHSIQRQIAATMWKWKQCFLHDKWWQTFSRYYWWRIGAEQSSLVRLQMRKKVEASGLHRSVIFIQNRNNNN